MSESRESLRKRIVDEFVDSLTMAMDTAETMGLSREEVYAAHSDAVISISAIFLHAGDEMFKYIRTLSGKLERMKDNGLEVVVAPFSEDKDPSNMN